MFLGVPEGRHSVAHRACPERSEGEAVGKLSEDAHKTPLGVTHGCGLYLQPAIKMDLSRMEWTGRLEICGPVTHGCRFGESEIESHLIYGQPS